MPPKLMMMLTRRIAVTKRKKPRKMMMKVPPNKEAVEFLCLLDLAKSPFLLFKKRLKVKRPPQKKPRHRSSSSSKVPPQTPREVSFLRSHNLLMPLTKFRARKTLPLLLERLHLLILTVPPSRSLKTLKRRIKRYKSRSPSRMRRPKLI